MDELVMQEGEQENLFDKVDSTDQEDRTTANEEDRSTAHTYVDSQEESSQDESSNGEEKKNPLEDLYEDSDTEESDTEENDEYSAGQYDRFSTINSLQRLGYIDDFEEDVRGFSEDDLDVFIQTKMDEAINDRLRGSIEGLPDIVRQLNEYALAGGDVRTFFSNIASQNEQGIVEGMDLSDPYNQETIVYNTLQSQGYPQEYIQSQIAFLKESNNLQSHANAYYNQFVEARQAELDNLVRQQQEEEYMARQAFTEQRNRLDSYIHSIDEVAGMPLSLRDKKELTDYMITPAYTLEDGSTITQLQKDLYYDLIQNTETAIQLALLLKNRNQDGSLNLSNIQKQAETQVTKKVRENLRRQDRSVPNSSSDKYPTYKQKSLDSYFD